MDIIEKLKEAGETVATVGYSDSDYDLVAHADLGITSLENTTGSVYEASGLIVRDDNFSSVVEMIKEARQLHRNIKRCIFILLSTLIAFACTSLADMITGYGIITPMLAAVLTAAVIPLKINSPSQFGHLKLITAIVSSLPFRNCCRIYLC